MPIRMATAWSSPWTASSWTTAGDRNVPSVTGRHRPSSGAACSHRCGTSARNRSQMTSGR
ncbi:hypothetical protein ACFFX0_22100 [Citricoccus parietis]|uniref:Uncharacterized protein n=1 Tax=Citricoccus parietis TaxID=592307 RepID=A0ABV5G492_9MICC